MTDTDTPSDEPQNQSPKAKRSAGLRLIAGVAGTIFAIMLVAVVTGIWLVTSQSGAVASLSLLDKLVGIKSQGVSGKLISQLHVQHVEMSSKALTFSADDVALQWQPKALLQGNLQFDHVRINDLDVALGAGNGQPATLPKTLQLPDFIKLLSADQLEIRQFQLSTLDGNNHPEHPQQFSALKASASINATGYTLQFSGITPWGRAALRGNLASTAPFNIQAHIDWSGLAVKQAGVTLPATKINGTVTGNLSRLEVQAQIDTDAADKDTNVKSSKQTGSAGGQIQAVLTPFAILPVDTLRMDFSALNPTSFYKDAPTANLQLKADMQVAGDAKSPVLRGHLWVKNTLPKTWNSGGIPAVQISSDVTVSGQKISWTSTNVELAGTGRATGAGEFVFGTGTAAANTAAAQVILPQLWAQLTVSNVNLLRIDSRLKKTQLSGKIQAQNKDQALNFSLNLQESDPSLHAKVRAEASLNNQLMLKLQQLELTASDAMLTARGSIALRDKQEFALEGEAHNFNPARWIAVPDGHIATRFKLAGQVQQGWQVGVQLSELSGQFAGMDLHGESDFKAQQDHVLSIAKLDVNWGKNHLSANGEWQLGSHSDPNRHEQLQVNLAIPDLAALSRPFAKILPVTLQGSIFADGVLSGNAARPGGRLTIKANQLAIPDVIYLDNLQADIALADGEQGKIDGTLTLAGLTTTAPQKKSADDGNLKIEHLQASLTGLRHAHTIQLTAVLPQSQQITLQAQGDLQEMNSTGINGVHWAANISALNLSGPLDFQLQSPFSLQLSSSTAQMGAASWQGKLGQLHVDQIAWAHGQLKSSGHYKDLPVAKVLKLWRADLPIGGKLLLDTSWQVDIGQQVIGQIQIQRTSGDLTLQDTERGQLIALGLQNVTVNATAGGNGFGDSISQLLHEQIKVVMHIQGDQLGLVDVNLQSALNKTEQGWTLQRDAPMNGSAALQIKNINWMSPMLGSGVSLQGQLDAVAQLSGSFDKPEYQAKISGKELQVALTELGILLPNGSLDARIEGSQFNLTSLKFSQAIKKPPRHDNLDDITWLNETGFVESTGSVDLQTGKGAISTRWQKFPFLQNPESWMVASGQAQLSESEKTWNITGQLIADAAYFSVPKQASPKLSGDVVVLKKNDKRSNDKPDGLQTSLDFSISTGKKFIFVGRGIDTRLDGDIRIRSKNGGTLLATGFIQTAGGNYEGYGQKLAIDRGILNFQGPIDNPGLNIRAVRHGLPVEAGVEVVGTVARPEVHLISEPDVPDPDKLSWMVLGRPSDQMAGSEAALLMSAAGAIFGGDSGGSVPSNIAHSLGLEDLSFGTTSTLPESQLPTQTVAGTVNSTTLPNDQVFSVGKRIAPNIVFSIERSLTDASNGLKLTWQLTRRFSIIGRAGSDTAIDGQYTFSFD